jgi:hypothetical protein
MFLWESRRENGEVERSQEYDFNYKKCETKMIMIYGGDPNKHGDINNKEATVPQKHIESYSH